jgi:hypothetical protein
MYFELIHLLHQLIHNTDNLELKWMVKKTHF